MKPRIPPDHVPVQVNLPKAVHSALKGAADRRGMKFYAYIEKLLEKASGTAKEIHVGLSC